MAAITPIQSPTQINPRKKAHITGELTGLGAGVGLALTVASGYTKNKNFKKQHKNFAIATIVITVLHIFLPKLSFSRNNTNSQSK